MRIAGWVSGQRPLTATIVGREQEDPADDADDPVVARARVLVGGMMSSTPSDTAAAACRGAGRTAAGSPQPERVTQGRDERARP